MSWYGTHPTLSKEQVKKLIPPASCKLCVYRARTVSAWMLEHVEFFNHFHVCDRCGVTYNVLQTCYKAQKLGLLAVSIP